jgi:serine/threonine-protein kinase HipA
VKGKDIYAYLDTGNSPLHIGTLHCETIRGKEVFSFSGSAQWLQFNQARLLDPDLGPFEGRQFLRPGKLNFGIFLDSAPDRWGRRLLQRRELIEAKQEGRPQRMLDESDYLLSVFDGSRMGALRLKLDPDGDFLDNNADMAIPPWTSIRELEYASRQIEREDISESEYRHWFSMLVQPGSSLGGARPKANIADKNAALWIAKFPSGKDEKNIGAWEQTLSVLAADCGISVAESMCSNFSDKGSTFLTKRFDRDARGRRIHFASAMTLLGASDGDGTASGIGYLDIAGIIIKYSTQVEKDLEELWRRMVFNIAVSNCDDHLRNHGFLLSPQGWSLSPAYDMNPDENGKGLSLNINETDNSLDLALAMEVRGYFRLSEKRALAILDEVQSSVARWRSIAGNCGISRNEQNLMSPAFLRRGII